MSGVTVKDMAAVVSEKCGISKTKAAQVYQAYLDQIKDFLVHGFKVKLRGFVRLETVDKKEQIGRNPRTGDPITIPAHKTVKAKASKKLIEKVNKGPK